MGYKESVKLGEYMDTPLDKKLESAFLWYQQADTKAQVLLGISGVFLSLSLFSFQNKSISTDIFILITIIGQLISILLSVFALWSRGIFFDSNKGTIFFGRIANYKHIGEFKAAIKLKTSDDEFEQKCNSLYILSKNTRIKHRLINISALLCFLSLLPISVKVFM